MAQVGHGSIIITDLTDTLNTQHFWWTAEGESTPEISGGAYITDTPIKDFRTNPVGGNLLTRSNGLWLRNGTDLLVSLTSAGLVFYTPDQKAAAEIDTSGLNILDGSIVFEGNYNGVDKRNYDVSTNPSEYYWYELFDGEWEVVSEADLEEGTNPYEEEWYELINNEYHLTLDTQIVEGKIYYKLVSGNYILTNDQTINSQKDYYRAGNSCINLSDYGFNREIGLTLQKNLQFAIGDNFAVDSEGTLYANGAVLSGPVQISNELIISKAISNSIVNSSDISQDIDKINEDIVSLQSQVVDNENQILGSMTFGTEGDVAVLTIKASSDSPYSIKLTNQELQFLNYDSEVASISNQKLEITDAQIFNKLQFGSFAFIPRENGNLSLKYIGE